MCMFAYLYKCKGVCDFCVDIFVFSEIKYLSNIVLMSLENVFSFP